jgi:hypothetical protein
VIVLAMKKLVVSSSQIKPASLIPKEIIEKVKEYKLKIGYIKASSDYEYGKKAGTVNPDITRMIYDTFSKMLKNLGIPPVSPDHVSILAKNYPEYFQRLKGVQESTGISVSKLILIGSAMSSGIGCTTSASAPPATVEGQVFLTWNVDFSYRFKQMLTDIVSAPEISAPEIKGMPIFFVRDIESHNKLFCLGIPGVLEVPILNDRWLSLVGNAVSTTDDGPGLSSFELLNKVMDRCSTVEEAVDMLENSPRFSSSAVSFANLNYLFADAQGAIASVEATHKYFAVKYGKDTNGIIGQANHHQWLDSKISGGPSKERQPKGYNKSINKTCSYIRAARMWNLLEQNAGKIDLETVMSFTADTANGPEPGKGGYYSICRYGPRDTEEKIPGDPDVGTLVAFVTQPKKRIVWYCGAHPDEAPYVMIDVAEIFGE